ncbi:MAG: GIY-YIG nuclease family protein [Anaerovibrio sp.]|nr:GIY-YIG nuclease family protein [Anaerovibrio sp.]
MLECSDGTLYTGYTVDLDHRLAMHNAGKASRYTRCRLPARLVYYESFATKSEAMKRECAIKRLTRSQKLALIAAAANECNNFY